MNLRDLDLRIITEPGRPVSRFGHGRDRLVTYELSAHLTPAHIDVTSTPAPYARAKAFRFPTKRQLRVMDADRWVRQRIRAANSVGVSELPPVLYSVDNLAVLRGSQRFDRSTVAIIHDVFLNASRRFRFTEKIAR